MCFAGVARIYRSLSPIVLDAEAASHSLTDHDPEVLR